MENKVNLPAAWVKIIEQKKARAERLESNGLAIPFQFNDGGRKEAGYIGTTGDCVARAICIASGLPYQEVYDTLANGNATQRQSKYHKAKDGVRTAARGINVRREWFKTYMQSIGFSWTPTMLIGQGCKVHLKADELPKGRLVVAVSKHYTAVIDGTLNDIYDCSRSGDRCVYGYYSFTGKVEAPKPQPIEVAEVKVIEKPKTNNDAEKLNKLLATQKKWVSKAKRAETALNKLNKKIKYYQKRMSK